MAHWSAEGGHPIQDLIAEDDLTPLPGWTPGAKAISDDGRVAEERVLHPALTMGPPSPPPVPCASPVSIRCPGCAVPRVNVASPHEGSVVLGPVPDAIRCRVLRMHSRLHIEIMTRLRSRWSTCRPLLAHRAESAHQRHNPCSPRELGRGARPVRHRVEHLSIHLRDHQCGFGSSHRPPPVALYDGRRTVIYITSGTHDTRRVDTTAHSRAPRSATKYTTQQFVVLTKVNPTQMSRIPVTLGANP